MRALEPEVVDALRATIEPLIPARDDSHPFRCHRPRVPDRLCFRGILIRLVTGASWVDIKAILDHQVSDTTLRKRRDEWINAGVFDRLHAEALAAFDRIIGLDLCEVALDGSLHKAPYGGEGTGPNRNDNEQARLDALFDSHGLYLANDRAGALAALDRFTDLYATGDLPEFHPIIDTVIAWPNQILDWHDTAGPPTAASKAPMISYRCFAASLTDSPTPTTSPPADSF